MTNKQKFASTYCEAFKDCYPELPTEKAEHLMQKALETALTNIRVVNLSGKAFKETCKRLGIKHSYIAIEEYLNSDKQL